MADSDKDQDKLENTSDADAESTDAPDNSSESDAATSAVNEEVKDDESEDSDNEDSDNEDSDNEDSDNEDEDEDDYASADAPPSHSKSGPPTMLLAFAGIAIGAAGGWFGHQIKTDKALKSADAAVQGEGDAARGPCKDWETKICAELDEKSNACSQAKSASALLSGSACQRALASVPATIAKVKEARASCEEITNRLCTELGPETKSCELVKKQTPSFPPEKCKQMMESYPKILSQLQAMEKRGGRPGAGPRGPRGPGAGRPGGPPMRPPGHPSTSSPPKAPTAKSPAPKSPAPKSPAPKSPAPKSPAPKSPAPKSLAPKSPAPKSPAPAH